MTERCDRTEDAAGWVLGALDEASAATFAEHIARCDRCRELVAELGPAVEALAESAPRRTPPPALKTRIMDVARSEASPTGDANAAGVATPRRRWRGLSLAGAGPALVGGSVCAALAVGVAAGVLIAGGGSTDVDTATYAASSPAGSSARVTVSDDRPTLRLTDLPAPPRGRVYQVWLRRDGSPLPTGTLFTVPATGSATVAVDARLRGADRILVTAEPPTGSSAPTTSPVVSATLG